MHHSHDRRTFLRRAAGATLAFPALAAAGCSLERQASEEPPAEGPPRPILLPWGGDAIRVVAPPNERPLAYMSHRYMQVWVDLQYRDRLSFAFGAHISVSTGHWRIPLPGDSPSVPIQPGDPRREFEEVDMRDWDAEIQPTEGDVRILRGSPVSTTLRIECQPLSGGGTWFSAEPLRLWRCGAPSGALCREDLMQVGTAARYADRDCTEPVGSVRAVTWACRDPAMLEGV